MSDPPYSPITVNGQTLTPHHLKVQFTVPFNSERNTLRRRSATLISITAVGHTQYPLECDFDLSDPTALKTWHTTHHPTIRYMAIHFILDDTLLSPFVQQDIISAYETIIPLIPSCSVFAFDCDYTVEPSHVGVGHEDVLAGMFFTLTMKQGLTVEVYSDREKEWTAQGNLETLAFIPWHEQDSVQWEPSG